MTSAGWVSGIDCSARVRCAARYIINPTRSPPKPTSRARRAGAQGQGSAHVRQRYDRVGVCRPGGYRRWASRLRCRYQRSCGPITTTSDRLAPSACPVAEDRSGPSGWARAPATSGACRPGTPRRSSAGCRADMPSEFACPNSGRPTGDRIGNTATVDANSVGVDANSPMPSAHLSVSGDRLVGTASASGRSPPLDGSRPWERMCGPRSRHVDGRS